MADNLRPARVSSPGAVLQRELDARTWTQQDLATITKQPVQAISGIVSGTRPITAETALDLSRALGTSPELWLKLESSYQHWKAAQA